MCIRDSRTALRPRVARRPRSVWTSAPPCAGRRRRGGVGEGASTSLRRRSPKVAGGYRPVTRRPVGGIESTRRPRRSPPASRARYRRLKPPARVDLASWLPRPKLRRRRATSCSRRASTRRRAAGAAALRIVAATFFRAQAIAKYTEAINLDGTDVTFFSNRSAACGPGVRGARRKRRKRRVRTERGPWSASASASCAPRGTRRSDAPLFARARGRSQKQRRAGTRRSRCGTRRPRTGGAASR